MKKYEKPMIIIERFDLAEHIASCAFDKQGDVYISDDYFGAAGESVFTPGSNCTMTLDEAKAMFSDYCDTNGSSDGVKLLYNS